MKTLVIYSSSHHQNTAKIASVIASCLKAKLTTIDLVKPEQIKNSDLIGFGSGIYFGRFDEKLLRFIQNLPKTRGQKAFIFSTSGLKRVPFIYDFHKQPRGMLRNRGFKIVNEFSCCGWDSFGILKIVGGINKGRPNQNDLKKARQFANQLRRYPN